MAQRRIVSVTVLTAVMAMSGRSSGPLTTPDRRWSSSANGRHRWDRPRRLDPDVMQYAIGQRRPSVADEAPLPIFHPTMMVLATGGTGDLRLRRPIPHLRLLRDAVEGERRPAHLRCHPAPYGPPG